MKTVLVFFLTVNLYAQTVPTALEWWKYNTNVVLDGNRAVSWTGNNNGHVVDDTAFVIWDNGFVFDGITSKLRMTDDNEAFLPDTNSFTMGAKYKYYSDIGSVINYRRNPTTEIYPGALIRNVTNDRIAVNLSDGTTGIQTTIDPAGLPAGDSINVVIASIDRPNNRLYIYVNAVLINPGGADISTITGSLDPPPTFRKISFGMSSIDGDPVKMTLFGAFWDDKYYNQAAITNATNCLNGNCGEPTFGSFGDFGGWFK